MNKQEERIETELKNISQSTMRRLSRKRGFGILIRLPQEWHAVIKSESRKNKRTMSKTLGEICQFFYGDLGTKQRELLIGNYLSLKTPKNEFLPDPVRLKQKIETIKETKKP